MADGGTTTVALRVAPIIRNREVPAQVRADLTTALSSYIDATGATMREMIVTIDISHEQMREFYDIYRAYLARCAVGDRLLARHRQRRHK